MCLLKNSFYILSASTRDNRQRIMELSEDCSLLLDSNLCMDARSELTNPRKRLSAEIAWFPGVAPTRIADFISVLQRFPVRILQIKNITGIARTNLLVEGISTLSARDSQNLPNWILEIAEEFENIDTKKLFFLINEDRISSGFPKIADISDVEDELSERKRYYIDVIHSCFNKLSPNEIVSIMTKITETATQNGNIECPTLIAGIIDKYEVAAQSFFSKEGANISAMIQKIRKLLLAKAPDSVITIQVDQLIRVIQNWDCVAQPIQIVAKSSGIKHDESSRLAHEIRELAVDMYNEFGKLEFSKKLTLILKSVFAEIEELSEQAVKDFNDLEEIANSRSEADKNWEREITYSAEVGLFFKEPLRISPAGIVWQKHRWPLESITRIRWGGVRQSINGIPTGTKYTIFWANNEIGIGSVELKRESTFQNFVERLWKSVGVRLLTEYLQGLKLGNQYTFGDVLLFDTGMELTRRNFFTRNEQVRCSWEELEFWSESASFCVRKKGDKKVTTALSYMDEANIHILEAAIRMFLKSGKEEMSDILG